MNPKGPDSARHSVSRRQFLGKAARISAAAGLGGFGLLGKALAGDASILGAQCSSGGNYIEKPCRKNAPYALQPGEFCYFGTTVICGNLAISFICPPDFDCKHGSAGQTRVFWCQQDIGHFDCGIVDDTGGHGEFTCDNQPVDRFWCGALEYQETPVFRCQHSYYQSC